MGHVALSASNLQAGILVLINTCPDVHITLSQKTEVYPFNPGTFIVTVMLVYVRWDTVSQVL